MPDKIFVERMKGGKLWALVIRHVTAKGIEGKVSGVIEENIPSADAAKKRLAKRGLISSVNSALRR